MKSRAQRTCRNLHERKWHRVFVTTKELECLLFDCQISKNLKETMLEICKKNLKVIFDWGWILFCYMLFLERKYWLGVDGFHFLIQEQPLPDQSTSPCKSVRLNGEYRYLRPLLPQKHLLNIFSNVSVRKSNRKGVIHWAKVRRLVLGHSGLKSGIWYDHRTIHQEELAGVG